MNKILSHAKSITIHRDQSLVDMAMATSLLDMFGSKRMALEARLFHVTVVQDQMHFALSAIIKDGHVHAADDDLLASAIPSRMLEAMQQGFIGVEMTTDANGKAQHVSWLPISRDSELLGCIELSMPKPLTQRQLVLIDGMRGLYANYLSLLSYSQVDSLTQLLNRKTFDESLQRMLTIVANEPALSDKDERRGDSKEHHCWLAVLDIDHFKRINDSLGHLFGDEVLILVANLMRQIFRRKDKLFRFGGEEFVVLLRDTDEVHALRVFERFRSAIEAYEFPQQLRVTISTGLTRVQPADNPTLLLGRADEALYYAKHHGRNQVQFYDRLREEGKIVVMTQVNTEADLF